MTLKNLNAEKDNYCNNQQKRGNPDENKRNNRLTETVPVHISVYDATGQLVSTLKQEIEQPGLYPLQWNGRDLGNQPVSSGTYYVRFQVGSQVAVQAVTLVK